MTLFGSLSSGVSGLAAQSSAMGAISDNITNVSTTGYKSTNVSFQTLVTKQTSTTYYSAGGVQAKPRQDTGVQGLLQGTSSQTDISISGHGYFVVNEAAIPGLANEFVFTRAGSFYQDKQGFLRNSAGYYIQAWPTNAAAEVIPNNDALSIPNQNVISTDYLASINLNRVGGTAAATTKISIGANLPNNPPAGANHKTDVEFIDSLGTVHTISFEYAKSPRDGQWDIAATPPQGAEMLTLEDSSGNAFKSIGQLEFISRPADGARVTITSKVGTGTRAITYEFDSNGTVTESATLKQVDISTTSSVAEDVRALLNTIIASDSDFDATNNRVKVNPGNAASLLFTEDGTSDIVIDARGLLTTSGGFATRQETMFTVRKTGAGYRDYEQLTYSSPPADEDTIEINGFVYTFDDGEAADDGDQSIRRDGSYDAAALGTLNFAAAGTVTSTTQRPFATFQPGDTITFADTGGAGTNNRLFTVTGVNADGSAITVSPNPANQAGVGGASATFVSLHAILQDLEAAIEDVDPQFAAGADSIRTRTSNRDSSTAAFNALNTLVISNLAAPFGVRVNDGTHGARITSPDQTNAHATLHTADFVIDKTNAVSFNSRGVPQAFNVAEVEVLGFENGAASMDDDPDNSKQMTLDLGTVGKNGGLTQFGAEFEPRFIQTDGSQYGTFAGVTISENGLVTARFSNGETRPVYRIPVANFVNVNALESRTGNVWNSTEASGDPTLFRPDSGPVGKTIQAALEQSTVDIGEEFTKMIVVQRAFSAAAKIISTSDEMLEELLRTKR